MVKTAAADQRDQIIRSQYTKSITESREKKTPLDFNFQKRSFLFPAVVTESVRKPAGMRTGFHF